MENLHRGKGKTILLLEDEPTMREALMRTLEDCFPDAHIYDARNPGDFAPMLDSEGGKPRRVDIIISDQVEGQREQGGKSKWGIDFLRTAKKDYACAIRILISAQTNYEDIPSILDGNLVHHFAPKKNDDDDEGLDSVCKKLANVIAQVFIGNYDVLNFRAAAEDLYVRDLLVERLSEAGGEGMELCTSDESIDAESVVNDLSLLEDFKRSMFHGILNMGKGFRSKPINPSTSI
jgi:hypothetical protein